MRNDVLIRYQYEDGAWTVIHFQSLLCILLFISPMSSIQYHILPKSVKIKIRQAVDKIIDEELIAGRIRGRHIAPPGGMMLGP